MALLLALEVMLVAGGPRGISGMTYLVIYAVSGQRCSIFEPPRNISGGGRYTQPCMAGMTRQWRRQCNDPGRTRTCNPRLRRPMPYPLGHGACCPFDFSYPRIKITVVAMDGHILPL